MAWPYTQVFIRDTTPVPPLALVLFGGALQVGEVGRCRLNRWKPVLKAPGSMILKLRYDGPLSKFSFNFNLRRFSEVDFPQPGADAVIVVDDWIKCQMSAGAYTCPLFCST